MDLREEIHAVFADVLLLLRLLHLQADEGDLVLAAVRQSAQEGEVGPAELPQEGKHHVNHLPHRWRQLNGKLGLSMKNIVFKLNVKI